MMSALLAICIWMPIGLFDLYFILGQVFLLWNGLTPGPNLSKTVSSGNQSDLLTILIPTYNNFSTVNQRLIPQLKKIMNAELGVSHSIILVDSSTDGTDVKTACALGLVFQESDSDIVCAQSGGLCLIHLKNRKGGKAWAINKAACMVKSKYFAIIDSDWDLDMGSLVSATCYLDANRNISYAQLAWRATDKRLGFVEGLDQVSIEYRHLFENRVRILCDIPVTIHGSAVVLRTDDFRSVGGFDENILSEDVDLTIRLMLAGKLGQGISSLAMRQPPCNHWKQFLFQKSRWAEGRSQLLRKYAVKIITSEHVGLMNKVFWIYYLSYFFRCVMFSLSVLMVIFGSASSYSSMLANIGWFVSAIMIITRLIINFITSLYKENDIPIFCRLIEPLSFYGIGLIYTYTFFRGLVTNKGVWHVVEHKT